MFKGLKSKLEDEAKRLQATMTQYGENLAQQVRTGTSDNGSDISGYTRRLFAANSSPSAEQSERKFSQSTSDHVFLPTETIISLDDDEQISTPKQTSALLQGLDESEFMGERVRRLSNASMESNESSFSALTFPQSSSAAALRLDTISSDVESNAGSTIESNSFESAPREQLSSIFHKLQGRATNYKQKYRNVAKAYQEVVRENEKCRTVLATTQDKALQRISKLKSEKKELFERVKELENRKDSIKTEGSSTETKVQKLQDLLEKCRDRINANKTQISSLIDENASLKTQLADLSQDSAVEKVTAEWKGRVDRLEEEWSQRLASCDEKASIAIATSKAEMHGTLQQKDQEIEKWISKCHTLEKQDTDGNLRWQTKVDELNKLVVNLESEKADMVEKLSRAKQEGVKLVKEDEEKKREKLGTEYNEKLTIELMRKDDEWRKRIKELEEQMQLAIEEREMQKVAALATQDKKFDDLNIQLENLKTENMRMNSELEDALRRASKIPHDLVESGLMSKEVDAAELSKKVLEKEEEIQTLRNQYEQLFDAKTKTEKDYESGLAKIDKLESLLNVERRDKEASTDFNMTFNDSGHMSSTIIHSETQTTDALENLSKQFSENSEEAERKLALLDEEVTSLKAEVEVLKSENSTLKEQLGVIGQQNESYLKRCAELESLYESITARLTESEASVETLKNRLNEIVAEKDSIIDSNQSKISSLQSQIEEFSSERVGADDSNTILSNENKELRRKQNELEQTSKSEITNLQAKLDEFSTERAKSEKNMSTLKSENEQLKAQYHDSKEHLESEIAILQAKLDEFSTERTTLEKQMSTFKSENDQLRAQYQNSKEHLESKIHDLNSEIAEFTTTKLALEERIRTLNAENDRLKALYHESKEHLESEIVNLQAKLDESSTERATSEKKISTLKSENKALRRKQNELEQTSKSEIANLQARLDEFSTVGATSEKKLSTLKSENDQLKAQYQESKHHLESKIHNLESEIAEFTTTKMAFEERIRTMNAQNKQLVKRRGELDAMCEDKNIPRFNQAEKERIDTLAQENSELLRRCGELEALCELSKPTEIEYLRNVLYRYMTERETLGKEIVTLARVIGTVVKFTSDQLELAVKKEEIRYTNQGWYGDQPDDNSCKSESTVKEGVCASCQRKKFRKNMPVTSLSSAVYRKNA